MGQHRQTQPHTIATHALSHPERLAIWTLRCADHPPRVCRSTRPGQSPGLAGELLAVAAAIRRCQRQLTQQSRTRLQIAPWGSLHLTTDEACLLHAVAAWQAGRPDVADRILLGLTPGWPVGGELAQAVIALAATLETAGHWLQPAPQSAWRSAA